MQENDFGTKHQFTDPTNFKKANKLPKLKYIYLA